MTVLMAQMRDHVLLKITNRTESVKIITDAFLLASLTGQRACCACVRITGDFLSARATITPDTPTITTVIMTYKSSASVSTVNIIFMLDNLSSPSRDSDSFVSIQ